MLSLQVELKDGRQLEGDFQCLDKHGNLVLSNSCELIENPLSKQSERQMGMVLIPKAYQVKVQVKVSEVILNMIPANIYALLSVAPHTCVQVPTYPYLRCRAPSQRR